MAKPGVLARMRYRLDLLISRSPLAVIGYLAVITLAIVLVAAAVLTTLHLTGVNGGPRLTFPEAFWQSLLRMLGKGAFASDKHVATRILNLVVTLTGIFLAGALIGLITTAVNHRIADLRKGRSEVLETDHTLVLGWSPRLPVILSQLVIANSGRRQAAFVVLADRAKDEMEDELRRQVPHLRNTRLVCRQGDPGKPADLHLVNIEQARAVIVLAGPEGDSSAVKSVLSVRHTDPTFAHTRVVAELRTMNHARTLQRLTDNRIAAVQADQVISEVTAQACHQGGLAAVIRELLDFEGNEIYFDEVPDVVGRTYGDALHAFETSCLIGVCRAGVVTLDPPADTLLAAGDELIAVAPNDDRLRFTGFVEPPAVEVRADSEFVEPAQRIALVGWSPLGSGVVHELDRFLGVGSTIDILVDRRHYQVADIVLPELHRSAATVQLLEHGPESLVPVLAARDYDQVVVLGDRHRDRIDDADATTMLVLLAMNHALAERATRPRIVAEMLDRANVEVAKATGVDDFIVSDELSSLMLAQVSERFELQDVFAQLFDADGCFISLHPAPLYAPAHPVTFGAIVAAAATQGQSALGYRAGTGSVVLNPPKSTVVELGAGDEVLVLGPRREHAVAPVAPRVPTARPRVHRSTTPRMLSRAVREAKRGRISRDFT